MRVGGEGGRGKKKKKRVRPHSSRSFFSFFRAARPLTHTRTHTQCCASPWLPPVARIRSGRCAPRRALLRPPCPARQSRARPVAARASVELTVKEPVSGRKRGAKCEWTERQKETPPLTPTPHPSGHRRHRPRSRHPVGGRPVPLPGRRRPHKKDRVCAGESLCRVFVRRCRPRRQGARRPRPGRLLRRRRRRRLCASPGGWRLRQSVEDRPGEGCRRRHVCRRA